MSETRLVPIDRRPRLLKRYETPWGVFEPGELLETNFSGDPAMPWTLGEWELDAAEIDEYPKWFEWVYFCGECGEEVCFVVGEHPAHGVVCHGHVFTDILKGVNEVTKEKDSPSRYPVKCTSKEHFFITGSGAVMRCTYWPSGVMENGCSGYPIWATHEDALEYAEEVRRLAEMTAKRFEERDTRK